MNWWQWALVGWLGFDAALVVVLYLAARRRERREIQEQAEAVIWSLAKWRELDRLEDADR